MYTDRELKSEMYGEQTSSFPWSAVPSYPPSSDRQWANLGQPLKQLPGEPSPEALWCLFSTCHGKNRAKLAQKYFGKGKRGARPA